MILLTPGCGGTAGKGVLTVAPSGEPPGAERVGKKARYHEEAISFGEADLEGTIQPHEDALVITARMSGFDVRRVMIDQGSGADVMYPDLFNGLGLKKQDLRKYNTPLVSFDGRVVVPEGRILLPVVVGGKEVKVTFIVVNSFSPYTAILGRPWIHAMKAVPSTLHVKVKFPTEQGIAVVRGCQQMARHCLVAAATWEGQQTELNRKAEEALL